MNLYHNYSALKLECYACKSNNHFINDCSTIHLNLDKEFVLKRGLFPHLNDRDFYARFKLFLKEGRKKLRLKA